MNFRAALAALVSGNPNVDAYALFEDDVELTLNLRAWLEKDGLWASEQVGVMSLFTASVHHRSEQGWHTCDELPNGAYGAQGYIFPPSSARDFISIPPVRNTWAQQDYWVGRWCRNARLDYWMHSPSLARHLGEVSTITNQGFNDCRQCRQFLERIDIENTP